MENKKRKKNGGFTLVELLATIAILSIVVSIGVGTITSVINKTNEKAYETTINNVVSTAKNFIIENSSSFGWFNIDIDSEPKCSSGEEECQYQCVTVKKLIDLGYFSEDILESNITKDTTLDEDSVVYLERNKKSKTITFQKLDDGSTLCTGNSAVGRIEFSYDKSWSREKKVKITYIANEFTGSGYRYSYSFEGTGDANKEGSGTFGVSNVKTVQTGTLTSNGKLTATIEYDGKSVDFSLDISKIDRVAPIVKNFVSLNEFIADQKLTMTVSDNESGVVGYYFGKKNEVEEPGTLTDEDFIKFSSSGEIEHTINDLIVNDSGEWYAHAVDAVGNYSIQYGINLNRIKFEIGNSADVPADLTFDPQHVRLQAIPGKYADLSNVKLSSNEYSIVEWYTNKSLSSKIGDITNVPIRSKTLYAKVVKNKITAANVAADIVTGFLNAGVSDIKLSTDLTSSSVSCISSGITCTYQWYESLDGTNSNGKIIDSAKNGGYMYTTAEYGKKVYVKVTITKDNYETLNVVSNVLEIPKGTGYVNLSSTFKEIAQNSSSSLNIPITGHHGGTLSCSTSNLSKVTCQIRGNSLIIGGTYNKTLGNYSVDVTSGETDSYTSGTRTFVITVKKVASVIK